MIQTAGDVKAKHIALFFTPSRVGGGVGRSMLDLATALTACGCRVDFIVSRAEGPYLRQVPPEVNVIVLSPLWGGLRIIRSLLTEYRSVQALALAIILTRTFRYLPALVRYLQQQTPDALVSAKTYPNLAALWARRLAHVSTRIVITERTNLSHEVQLRTREWRWQWHALPRVIRHLYPWADAIVSVSDGVADDLCATTGLSRDRVRTIYNPVVTHNLITQAQLPPPHPWFQDGNPPVILAAGRLEAQKDFSTLLAAFARVRAVRAARLVILGEGKERARLAALARNLGVAADVAFPGFVDNPFPYMAQAAVFVLSSTHEGLPGVLIQAMACGCPVVSTDCPSGPREVLAEGRIAPLVPVGDVSALAGAILATLQAPPSRETLRAHATQFSAERAVSQYLEVCSGR
ncbi:MAG: glycosyltransferase [Candidatus Binatia bacterium]